LQKRKHVFGVGYNFWLSRHSAACLALKRNVIIKPGPWVVMRRLAIRVREIIAVEDNSRVDREETRLIVGKLVQVEPIRQLPRRIPFALWCGLIPQQLDECRAE
jgi:hypothetical protein